MSTSSETLRSSLGLDTTDFKAGLADANRELRVLESGFRSSVSTIGDWGESIDGVQLRQKSLTDQISIQKDKVEALRGNHERLATANGETSISAENAQVALNKETEKLGNMQTELAETDTALDNLKAGNDAAGRSATENGEKQASMGQQVKMTFTEINSAVAIAKQVYQLLNKAVDETVGEFVTYADQVRDITLVTGQQAEEVSRLIQFTDDHKIKTESLNTVMKKMASDGLPLTTDSLAKLSDEYLKLAPGAERQLFLTKEFGKPGADFAETMLLGGKAIRDESAAISGNLILTEESLQKARDYEIAQDELNDTWMGVKIALGEYAIPPLIEFNKHLVHAAELAQLYSDAQAAGLDVTKNNSTGNMFLNGTMVTQEELLVAVKAAQEAATAAAAANQAAVELEDGAFFRFNKTLGEGAVIALDAANASSAALYSTIGTLQGITDSYNDTQDELVLKQTDIQTALDLAIKQGYSPTSEKIQGLKSDLEGVNTALGDAAAKYEDESRRAIFAIMMQKAASDEWQPGELEKLLKLGEAWGIYSEDVVNEAGNINAALENESATLEQIQGYAEWQVAHPKINMSFDYWLTTHGSPPDSSDKTITYTYNQRGGIFNIPSGPVQQMAGGADFIVPPGFPNDSFPLRVQSGERVIVIPSDEVTSLDAAMRGMTGSFNQAVNGPAAGGAAARAGGGSVSTVNSNNRNFNITNAGIDAAELERIERRKELLYGN